MESAIANIDMGRYRRLVQMLWDPEPSNDAILDRPVWCLGCLYCLGGTDLKDDTKAQDNTHTLEDDAVESNARPERLAEHHADEEGKRTVTGQACAKNIATGCPQDKSLDSLYSDVEHEGNWPPGFIRDFESRFWMSYRSEFQAIPRSKDPRATSKLSLSMRIKHQLSDGGLSSDTGWGCMIRSGQSLLANTLGILRLGREWRRGQNREEERRLVSLFADHPEARYSIHQFVSYGAAACEKYPGEWFGPSATARCIQALVNKYEPTLRVYSTGDSPDVYEDSFMETAKVNNKFHPTLILIGTRLGINKVTPVYWEALISALQMPQSVGIAGGRPSSSHYFVGSQGAFLFFLDPHHTRPALPYRPILSEYTDEEVASCHTSRLRRLHVREMDPSMLIGFLIKSEEDWTTWRRGVKHVQGKAIIHVADHKPNFLDGETDLEGLIGDVEPLSDSEDNETMPKT